MRTVVFAQSSLFQYYGGSYFDCNVESAPHTAAALTSLYVVSYLPDKDRETKSSLAWRLTRTSVDPEHELFRRYVAGLGHIRSNSHDLVRTEPKDPWHLSVSAWSEFQRKYPIYQEATRTLCTFGAIQSDHDVLDLGCGSGESLKILADVVTRGRLVAIDSSPEMVRSARSKLLNGGQRNGYKNLAIVVADAISPAFGVYTGVKFDRITVRFSLQTFLTSGRAKLDLASLGAAWRDLLKDGGEVVICVHNGVLECDYPPGFGPTWEDPLRKALVDNFSLHHGAAVRHNSGVKLTQSELVEQLAAVGLRLIGEERQHIARTMEDRIAMWRTPAVLDSLVDVSKVPQPAREEILDRVAREVRGQRTMPMTVVFLRFGRAKVPQASLGQTQ